jgi:hypothetical protein
MPFNEAEFRKEAKASGEFTNQEIEDAIKEELSFGKSPETKPTKEDVSLPSPFTQYEPIAKAGLYLGSYKLGRALIPSGGGNPPDDNTPPPNNRSSIMDRRFEQGKEPTFFTSENSSITPAAQLEIDDPVIRNGIRKSQLEGHFGVNLPKDPSLLEAFVNSYENKFGKQGASTTTDLFGAGNIRPGEHTMGPGNAPIYEDTPLIKDELPQPPKPEAPPPDPIQEAKKIAPQAPIPDGVNPQQASTIANLSNASENPKEKTRSKKAIVPPDINKQELGMKNHLLGLYGGKNLPMASEAYEKVKDILGYTPAYPPGQGGGLAPEETAKILGYRKENIPGPKINLTHDMKKVIKAGGIASLLSLPAFINAKTIAERNAAMSEMGESLLPLGLTPSTAGAPVLPPDAYSESRKLGSPFYKMFNPGIAPPGMVQR